MFLKFEKGGKNRQYEYVSLVEAYRTENNKIKHRVIERFGRKDLLLKEDPEAIVKLQAKYGGTREEKDRKAADIRVKKAIEDLQQASDTLTDYPVLKYGHYPIQALWKNVLELDRKFDYQNKIRRFKFDLNKTVCLLSASKIMEPSSILRLFDEQDKYLGAPIFGVPLDSIYDSLSVVSEQKDSLMKWTNKAISREVPDDRASLVFYDVTNTYFESAMTDAERGYEQADFAQNLLDMASQARALGTLSEECFDDSGNVIPEALPAEFIDAVLNEKIQYLKMRGPSKEHRFDLPLVSVALVIDRYGFPMDFEVFSGNTSEFKGMEKVIKKFQDKYAIKETIVVADRGLNSGANLKMLNHKELGFLMSQKVTGLGEKLTKRMLDQSLYDWFDEQNTQLGRYQVVNNWQKNSSAGAIDCTLVFTFSEKRKKRDEKILEIWKDIVLAKKAQGVKVKSKRSGWSCLAKTKDDLREGSVIVGVDEKVYEKKKALCGYAAIIYKGAPEFKNTVTEEGEIIREEIPGSAKPLSPQTIAGCYHQLNQIEQCFRIMKTNLGLRPMYVWNSEHVKGHITVCILALMLIRLIQFRLKNAGAPMSVYQICHSLRDAEVVIWKNSKGELLAHPTRKGVEELRKGRERMDVQKLIELARDLKKEPKPIDLIMQVCGLSPLKGTYSRKELQRALGTKFADDQTMVGPLVWESLL